MQEIKAVYQFLLIKHVLHFFRKQSFWQLFKERYPCTVDLKIIYFKEIIHAMSMTRAQGKNQKIRICMHMIVSIKAFTFSPLKPVSAKVENIGNGGWAFSGQHSTTAPSGRQNNGMESGSGNSS